MAKTARSLFSAGTLAIQTGIKSKGGKANYRNKLIKGRKICWERKTTVTAGVSSLRKLRDQMLAGTFQTNPEL